MTWFSSSRAFGPLALVSSLVVGGATPDLPPATLDGWNSYAGAVEARRARETSPAGGAFLVLDRGPSAGADLRGVVSGHPLVKRMEPPGIDVPDALVHHWLGAVFLPGADLDVLLRRLQSEAPPTSPEVLRATVLARGPSFIKVFLRLQRTKIVTAVYNTEHEVTFVRLDHGRAASRSVATRIAEVDAVGTAAERERTTGDDRGFLWRLNAYWRYRTVPGGVVAECESISLSRDVPFGLGAIAGPIIRSTARESMERTLASLREMVTTHPPAEGRP
jgi:hypothetical protein